MTRLLIEQPLALLGSANQTFWQRLDLQSQVNFHSSTQLAKIIFLLHSALAPRLIQSISRNVRKRPCLNELQKEYCVKIKLIAVD